MARTESVMAGLGTPAPAFALPDVSTGSTVTLDSFVGKKGLLVMFISRHCPYVQHVKHELARLGRDYRDANLGIVAICSNYVPDYPDDSPESLREMAAELELTYPVCYDESQDVAKSYQAACTPDFFLYDQRRVLVYRGQLDGSRPKNDTPVTGRDLRGAIDSLLSDNVISAEQRPSLGCNIKWRPGSEPGYYSRA